MNPMNDLEQKVASLEAILFIHGEPLTFKRITDMLGLQGEDLEAVIAELSERLKQPGRGLMLIRDGEKLQLVTKPQFHDLLSQFVKAELAEDLTQAALETLAIISYFGPISRSRIEYQRGVNSMFTLRSLLLRGLIERSPDPAHPNSFLYRPSFDLLKHLGLGRPEELPEYAKFQELLQKFESKP